MSPRQRATRTSVLLVLVALACLAVSPAISSAAASASAAGPSANESVATTTSTMTPTTVGAPTTAPAASAPASARLATKPPSASKPTPTSKPKPPSATKPTAPAGPPKTSIRLYVLNAFFVEHQPVTVPNRTVHVGGVVRPFVAGQSVTVRTFLGRRMVKSDQLRIKRSRNGTYGAFTVTVSSPKPGAVTVDVRHAKTDQMVGLQASREITVLAEDVGFGSTGRFVQLVQQQLAGLHFYIPQTGVYDQGTGLAVDAYHRLLRRGFSQSLDASTIDSLLNGVGTFRVLDPRDGTHVEGNLSDQLLALIDGSSVYRIYPISSGKPSTPTVLGHFSVYQRTPGYLPDGMYYSDFFIGGYAIHGYDPAPDYPASHGCMRLPIVDAISVFKWLTYGDVVDVYYAH
jgi:L,D-transpeptidase catalytic domain